MHDPGEPEVAIFGAALQLPASQRAAYLAAACADDHALRRRVEAFLSAHVEAGAFLESPACTMSTAEGTPLPGRVPFEKPGDKIGDYKLLQPIGEGGCGVVYLAEQDQPVRRLVALKVIKLGMDTKSVVARFEAERQALALMDHPNIAKVLDAGATDTGRPYFVMELVRGTKITDYCDENNLPTRKRLDLFIQVCRAIQHAHQKGIIHRDIKPSNILVTMHDGIPMPKVIDFGIAKATHGKLTDHTLFTAFEQFLGTPAYMSPEQAEMSALDIDTRSDIYSLGVLLYELLTGQTPFNPGQLRRAGLDEIRRTIREEEPVRPSTRLSTMRDADLTKIAKHREAEPPKLIHLVRGDLDWIVMKALEKDRTRRYETANGLAMDIQRHLSNEPVLASPPGNLYRFLKLVRRNQLAFLAIGIVSVTLIFSLGVALVAAFRIQQAKEDATAKLRMSYLSEARATRISTQTGQRFASLEIVQKAAAIRSDAAVRDEIIACLAVSDLRVAKQTVITGHTRNELANFDLQLEHYAFGTTNGDITIRTASNQLVVAVLSAPGYELAGVYGFSADGKYLGARYWRDHEGASYWVWDWQQSKVVVQALQEPDDGHELNMHLAADISPDSRCFACGRWDGSISIYNLAQGQEQNHLASTRRFNRLRLNPENTLVACSSGESPQVEIREVASGQLRRTLACPTGVGTTAWSPDGKRLATAGLDYSISVWEVSTGRLLGRLPGHLSLIMSLAFSHAGNLLASASYDGVIRLWNPDNGRQIASHPGSSWQLQFSSDDRFLLGWQDHARYGVLEVAASQECRQLSVPRDGDTTTTTEFSPDGRILAAGTPHQLLFWDAHSGKEIGSFGLKNCDALVFAPDGRSLITVDRVTGVAQRSLKSVIGPAGFAYRLGQPRQLLEAPLLQDASLSQDGRWLAVTQPEEDRSLILDLRDPATRVVLAGHNLVNRIALSPDGRWAATASWNNSLVKIWDARSGEVVRSLSGSGRTRVAFSPDGRWLATTSRDNQLLEVGSWQPKAPPQPGFEGPAENFTAFSPDGRILARTEGHKIHLLETSTEQPLATLEAPGSGVVTKCRFSPDGSQLAALQFDQQVQLWNLRLIRQELARLRLDWDLPPYPPVGANESARPVTLEVESDPASPTPAP